MTPAKQTDHPLFDDASFYRAMTRESVWHDGGAQSVRDFFASLARKGLHEAWQSTVPQEPQPWGYGPELDRALHEFLLHNARAAQESAVRARGAAHPPVRSTRGVRVRGIAHEPTPALVRLPAAGGTEPPAPERAPATLFTGVGLRPTAAPQRRFAVNIDRLPAGRRCIVLILTLGLVARLARLLGWAHEPGREDEALAVLADALRPAALADTPETEEQLRRAFRLSGILAMAPGLEGTTTADGVFRAAVDLDRDCPGLESWTWLVVTAAG